MPDRAPLVKGAGARRVALVTGSARGIGRAIAAELLASGHEVIGVDLLPHDAGTVTRAVTADLADPTAVTWLAQAAGPVDVLVNNAGLLISRPFSETTLDDFERTIAVNLRARSCSARPSRRACASGAGAGS